MRRWKQLEDGNARLKKIDADLKREVAGMRLVACGMSIRRVCRALRFDTSTSHHKSRQTGQTALERRIKESSETRVCYGYPSAGRRLQRNPPRGDASMCS